MPNSLSVGLGEIKISRTPGDILVAFGLGSCLGIGMFDPISRTAGMLHAVLPERTNGTDQTSAKYVDTGIRALLQEMSKMGADPCRLIIRMAGGANMLFAQGVSTFDIGTRNITAALNTFAAQKLKLVGQDVGGNFGRTVRLYVADGRMTVRMMGNQERLI